MRPLTTDDKDKRINPNEDKRFDPFNPPKPTFHNCIRCLRQYKLTVPYDECVPINRDFCDECISDLPYEERAELTEETIPSQNISSGDLSPTETKVFLLEKGDFPLLP